MTSGKNKTERRLHAAGCAALLALLAVSSYAGAGKNQAQIVSVPVMIETVSQETLGAASLEQIKAELQQKRETALDQLQHVLDDPRTDRETAENALREKIEIAQRMEMEASVCALLAHMGFADAAVVAGEETLSIIAPWQAAENEQNRIRMIDAAAGQCALEPQNIKIIPAKK